MLYILLNSRNKILNMEQILSLSMKWEDLACKWKDWKIDGNVLKLTY